MISRFGLRVARAFELVAPDPFALAILLTLVVFAAAVFGLGQSWTSLVDAWGGRSGVWGLLAFGMQMALILVTGHALASSPAASRLLDALADRLDGPARATAAVAGVACTLAILNWGLGLIGGALFARRVAERTARRGIRIHYPLVVAAGYAGLLVWHGGFSGSAPLKMTHHADVLEVFGSGTTVLPLSLSQTLFSPLNLFVTGGLLILVPVAFALFNPERESDRKPGPAEAGSRPGMTTAATSRTGLARLFQDTPLLTLPLVLLLLAWAVRFYLPPEGPSGLMHLSPDSLNLSFLLLGLILHRTPARYGAAIGEAAPAVGGILLLFPLYAGIMGLMRASGLADVLASSLAASAGPVALKLKVFASAGLLNLFVPSGGGQWAIQGPVAMQAADLCGVDHASIVMAVAYGDQLTNMLQPFWALPLLAITGVEAREIVGYTALVMLVAAVWIGLGLILF